MGQGGGGDSKQKPDLKLEGGFETGLHTIAQALEGISLGNKQNPWKKLKGIPQFLGERKQQREGIKEKNQKNSVYKFHSGPGRSAAFQTRNQTPAEQLAKRP